MWKQLNSGQNVSLGDKLRYVDAPSFLFKDQIFEVVKTEQHYFEIIPQVHHSYERESYRTKKVVRHFDIGSYFVLEVWTD